MPELKTLPPVVFYPVEIEENTYCGELWGYFHKSPETYNLVFAENSPSTPLKGLVLLGYIKNETETETDIDAVIRDSKLSEGFVLGLRHGKRIVFYTAAGIKCRTEPYSLVMDLFSRNTGILESEFMLRKSVIIAGCGSVGSLVALELARAGVGNFLLIDSDILSYHNICRHQCTIADVGKLKVDAVESRILEINPTASVIKHRGIIEDVPEHVFNKFCSPDTLIVGCADNREGDLYANKISKLYKCSFLSIGLMKRAFAGEIFYSLYNENPCYSCLYEARKELSIRTSEGSKRVYDGDKENFEPGISADISFVTIIGVKIALDILNKHNLNFHTRLLNDLSHFTWICNTNHPAIGGDEAEYFSYPLQVTTSMEVAFSGECKDRNGCKLHKEIVNNLL